MENPEAETGRGYLLSNKLYDVLKLLALIIFPAIGTLYFGLSEIWGLPGAAKVVASIVVIDTFLGAIIKIGDATYNNSEARFDGKISVGPEMINLHVNDGGNPKTLVDRKDEVILKVVPEA